MTPSNSTVETLFTALKPLKGNAAAEARLLALRQLEATSPTRCTVERARAKFLDESAWFLRKCVAWFRGDDVDGDDLEQTATIAYWSACKDWEQGRSPLLTFARWRIRTALRGVLRASRIVRGACRDVLQLDAVGFDDDLVTA